MPVPTDTYWNIKRLNVWFAASSVVLVLVCVWATVQDYDRDWRRPQQAGKVWEAALTQEKIERELSPDRVKRIGELDKQIAELVKEIEKGDAEYARLQDQFKKLDAAVADRDFRLGTLKANVGVMEGNLQDAITEGDAGREREIRAKLEPARRKMHDDLVALEGTKGEFEEVKKKMGERTAVLAEARKERAKLTADVEALRKKQQSLQPRGFWPAVSDRARKTPLLQFINPAERVQQVVLPEVQTDVAFMKITTIDRCMTCHVNAAKREFSRENVLGYLEEQVASARGYRYSAADPARPPGPTVEKPGATALPEFWHAWGKQLLGDAGYERTVRFQVASIAGAVGKTEKKVEVGGRELKELKYDFKATTQPALAEQVKVQDEGLLRGLEALYLEDPEKAAMRTARNNALAYPERLKAAVKGQVSAKEWRLLEDRYRYALVREVNKGRAERGYKPLDASAVLLAHPNLDLYVDVDSKHSFESVGCTSCHDGSGLETDFVLAAHRARAIWVDERTGEPVLGGQIAKDEGGRMKDEGEGRADLASMLDAVFSEGAGMPGGVRGLEVVLNGHGGETGAKPQADSKAVRFVDPVTGKAGRAVSQFGYWRKTYEPAAPRSFELVYHEWDWPMREPELIEANCVRCHNNVQDIADHAPVVNEGRYLFASLGCVNCHQMDSIPEAERRRVGTDLRRINGKLSPAMINTWIWSPKGFRPSTKMPHFFMLENNSSDEEIRRTRQEARAITEYLVRTASELKPLHKAAAKGDAKRGKEVFAAVGCLGCHANLNETGEKWITADLQKRGGKSAAEAKTIFAGMNYNERQLYAYEHLSPVSPNNELEKYADGTRKPNFVRQGPELSGIGTKLLAGRKEEDARQWLFDWLKEPRHYSEYTIMPRLRLTDQEAGDLTEYLLAQKRTVMDPKDGWRAELTPTDPEKLRELTAQFLKAKYTWKTAYEKAIDEKELTPLAAEALTTAEVDAKTAAERAKKLSVEEKQLVFLGKKLIANYGCMSCHAINGAEAIASPCANLSDWGQKQVSKLDYGYLDGHKRAHLPETAKVPLVNAFSVEGANLGHAAVDFTKPVAKEVEVGWPEVHHTRDAWIVQKLKNTRVWDRGKANNEPVRRVEGGKVVVEDPGKPYDKLKMPTFYLNEAQVHAIVTFVLSNRDRLIGPRLLAATNTEEARTIAKGRALVEMYNCVGCHQIEKNVPQVQQFYEAGDVVAKAPPPLRGEGNKVQHAWLWNFLKNVEPLRPLPVIRMPTFPWTDEEATAVAAYFAAVSTKESKELRRTIEPVLRYVAEARARPKPSTRPSTRQSEMDVAMAAAPAPKIPGGAELGVFVFSGIEGDVRAAQPGDDWYAQPQFARAAEELRRWALDYRQTVEADVDPARNKPDALGRAYRTILYKAVFTAGLYNAPWPFTDSPRPEISEARFKQGEAFLHEMQCLTCHFMGDPAAPGSIKEPKAPNLGLTYRRLQRRWVRHWTQEPPVIQAGTAMPQFFSGLNKYKVDGLDWAAAQGLPEARIKETRAKYGKTAEEQEDLLLDFLYAAGVRNHTTVQPTGGAATQPTKVTERGTGKEPRAGLE